jgi:DNA-binding transcriptional ArsR family regulator
MGDGMTALINHDNAATAMCMTEEQYAAELAKAAAATRKALRAHNERMEAGICSFRAKDQSIRTVIAFLKKRPRSTTSEIVTGTGYSKRNVQHAISELIGKGYIRSDYRAYDRVFSIKGDA